jgi:23S rRNA (pseudouridine1915-N3)-methyltransferase
MQLMVIAVGHKMPVWIQSGFDEYAKRMPAECKIVLKEVKPAERQGSKGAQRAIALERTKIEAAIPKQSRIVVLDERGKDVTTLQLATTLANWQQTGGDTCFVIGGADGLDAEFKARADMSIRLSSLTLPHGLVRVLLAEQLYRAWSILQNHPYHRGS